ncbi:MAG TPA: FAD-dependent oxidoreductase [Opitutaceae bacterium]
MSSPRYYRPAQPVPADAPPLTADLCIYGANAAGIMAAVQARRLGLSVTLLEPSAEIGGLTSGGLSFTDLGNADAIGGLAREFYRRVGAHYGSEINFAFEPHVARKVLDGFLREAGVTAECGQYVASARCERDSEGAPRIVELTTTSGLRVRAAYFIDCSYEGDLMAAAGASFTVGREARSTYNEVFNGQQIHASHQFAMRIDPYVKPGDPRSGLLPGIDTDDTFVPGSGDRRVQAYNFRVCMTKNPANRVPFPQPAGYRRNDYELLARVLAAGWSEVFQKFDRIRGEKTDTNNHGPVSTDFIGQNWAWPTADYATREKLFQAHVTYQQGYHWFMANDPAVPAPFRSAYAEWGLAADEFTDTGHWPHQLYVREARRLVGHVVMTSAHCLSRETVDDVIGLGAYQMDSHNCRRLVHAGCVLNEGDVQVKLPKPYGISYRAIVPRAGECANLLVPVCASASHIAYGSIRMEPVFMTLAQSAVIAASVALQRNRCAVQTVPYLELKPRLEQARQVVSWDPTRLNGLTGNPVKE